MNGWQRKMFGEWLQPTPEEQRLAEMAEKYVTRCDTYDRNVCTGMFDGESIPLFPDESRAINDYALQVRRDLIAEYNVTDQAFHDALKKYMR